MLWSVSLRYHNPRSEGEEPDRRRLPKSAVIRGAAGFFILFAAAVAASTIACGLVRQSIPAQVRSPGL
jgi:hypothetical protein